MFRGLYIAGTGMIGNTTAIDVVSNNLSNTSTLSYKKDFTTQESFNDVLISKLNGQSVKNNNSVSPIKVTDENELYSVTTTRGYFRVKNDEGISNNSALKFRANEEGYLSTYYLNDNREPMKGEGNLVQGAKGKVFVGQEKFTVDENGQVLVGGQVKDKLLFNPSVNVIGTMNSGIRVSRISTDFEQGDLQVTDNPLDLAIEGKGFFEVETPAGNRYTRNGAFKINADFEIVTSEGYKVIGSNGPIVLKSDDVVVNKFGEIAENGVVVDKFKMINPLNTENMVKIGQSMYKMTKPIQDQPFSGEIVQGSLEGSNTSSITEMIELLRLYRSYETNQRIITSYDSTMEKLLTDLGR